MPQVKSKSSGSIYSQDKPESRRIVEKVSVDPFIAYCKTAYRYVGSYAKGAKLTVEQREIFEFLNYQIKPEEFRAGQLLPIFAGTIVGILLVVFGFLLATGFDPLSVSED